MTKTERPESVIDGSEQCAEDQALVVAAPEPIPDITLEVQNCSHVTGAEDHG